MNCHVVAVYRSNFAPEIIKPTNNMAKQSIALSFRNYIWLADTIASAGRISRWDINRKWARSPLNAEGQSEIPERTFHNWKHAIEDLFALIIECDRRTGAYYIANIDDMRRNGLCKWLVNTFALNNLLSESRQLKDRILLEEIPGICYLTAVIEAMRDGRRLRLTYCSFEAGHASTFCVDPYCVKVFRQRWYMLALSEGYEHPRLYALDRVCDLVPLDETYTMPAGFDAKECFRNLIGVSGIGGECEIIRIKVKDAQVPYFRTLPIHASQHELERGPDYVVFEYYLSPNYEFFSEIFRNMCSVEVLSPEWLRNEVKAEAEALLAQYQQ